MILYITEGSVAKSESEFRLSDLQLEHLPSYLCLTVSLFFLSDALLVHFNFRKVLTLKG